MKRVSANEYRRNLVMLTAAWMLSMDEDDIRPTEDMDMVAIRRAKDTLLSIDEEVADYEETQDDTEEEDEDDEKLELGEPDLLKPGLS